MRATIAAAMIAVVPCHALAQTPTSEQRVARILETSSLRDLLSDAKGQILSVIVNEVPASDSADVREVVDERFLVDSLERAVVMRITAVVSDSILDDLESWLFTGPVARADSIRKSNGSDVDFESYARSLRANPPDQARLQAVVRHAKVQHAAGFYVLVGEAMREALEGVEAALAGRDAAFAPMSDTEYGRAVAAYSNLAVMGFLQEYEAIPLDLLQKVTERFASPAGQWYVEQYSLAVAAALQGAGKAAAATIRER